VQILSRQDLAERPAGGRRPSGLGGARGTARGSTSWRMCWRAQASRRWCWRSTR
jgi:hypothetical protein